MIASRDARAEVYSDVSAIPGPFVCAACRGNAVQPVADVCSAIRHIGETEVGYVACFPGEHLKEAFAAPVCPEPPRTGVARKWFMGSVVAVAVMAGLLFTNQTAGATASAMPIACLTIAAIDQKRERRSVLSFQSKKVWHDEEIKLWKQLIYCHHCGQVFVPNGLRSAPPDQWRRLMV